LVIVAIIRCSYIWVYAFTIAVSDRLNTHMRLMRSVMLSQYVAQLQFMVGR